MGTSGGGGGRNNSRIGCFTVVLSTILTILILLSLWEVNRMRQDLILLKQAHAGSPAMLELISKAKMHSTNAQNLIASGNYRRADDQLVLVGDTLNGMDEQIRRTEKEAERVSPSIMDFIGGIFNYIVNFVRSIVGR